MNFISTTELQDRTPDVDWSKWGATTISGMITSATTKAENYLGYTLYQEDKTEKVQAFVDSDDDLIIYPTKRPINSISSIQIVKGSYSMDVSLTSGGETLYDIPDDNSCIVVPGSTITLDSVSVINYQALKTQKFFVNITYNAGYDMATGRPEDIKDAVILFVRDEIARQFNTSGAKRISQGAVSIEYSGRKGESDFIKDAKSILKDYKNVTGF